MRKLIIQFFIICLTSLASQAQIVTYNGLGRNIIQDDNFKGNLIENDSVSPSSGTSGYILFDLGVNIHPSPILKASAILRSRMEFGGFFGDGASLEFRQFNISGVVGKGNKGLKYEMGDMDLEMSPFTLFNHYETYHQFESDIFEQRREIISYENFNFGNKWRLQGVKLNGNLLFDRIIQRADLKVFGTRQINSINFEDADRYLFGTTLSIEQSKNLKINLNATHYTDATSTVKTPTNQYQNTVLTGALNYEGRKKSKAITANLEAGLSSFSYSDVGIDQSNDLSDVFSHLEITGKLDSLNLAITAGYRYVGFDFLSSGAQTRRTLDYGVPTIFGSIREETAFRNPVLFDRYSQLGIYNQELSPTLMAYNPRYNLASPYGLATPNRTGFSVGIHDLGHQKWWHYQLDLDVLTEVVGEGTTNRRNFVSFTGGTELKINELLKTKRALSLNLGIRNETSNRDDDLVNFSVMALDAGVDIEILKKLFVQVGLKTITSSGNEFLGLRNEFNEITSYQAFNETEGNSDIQEQILSTGLRFNFGQYSTFLFNAHFASVANQNNTQDDYQIHEYFFGYTLMF